MPVRMAAEAGGRWPTLQFEVSPETAGTKAVAAQEKYNESAEDARLLLTLMWRGGMLTFNDLAAEYERQDKPRPQHDGALHQWLTGRRFGSKPGRDEALEVARRRCQAVIPHDHQRPTSRMRQLPPWFMLMGAPVKPQEIYLERDTLRLTVRNLSTGEFITNERPPGRQSRRPPSRSNGSIDVA